MRIKTLSYIENYFPKLILFCNKYLNTNKENKVNKDCMAVEEKYNIKELPIPIYTMALYIRKWINKKQNNK